MNAGPVPLEHTMPPASALDEEAYAVLRALVGRGGVVALTGAGMSTASGIPDYRGPDGQRRVEPMQHGEFVASAEARQRYWARAFAGWSRFSAAGPNVAHVSVARLQEVGLVDGVITQNVDGLHQRAGAQDVLELHGALDRVTCLDCGEPVDRVEVQAWLAAANPGFLQRTGTSGEVRPDGDVVLEQSAVSTFRAPRCLVCAGDRLKPDVVFFGGSVPRAVVEQAFAMVEDASTLLVLGSSLRVMSGYRFVRKAARLGIPVAVVTRGQTRGEGEPVVHLDCLLGDVLPRLVEELSAG